MLRDPAHPLPAAVATRGITALRAAEPPRALTYILGADGLCARGGTDAFDAWVPLAAWPATPISGLAPLPTGLHLRVPLIPARLLHTVLLEALHITRSTGHEALWHLCYDGAWSIVRPRQETSHAAVRDYDRAVPHRVLTLHSHGSMAAYFSRTDDADDCGLSLEGVIGNLGHDPAAARILLRATVYGHHLPVPLSTLLDGPATLTPTGDRPPHAALQATLARLRAATLARLRAAALRRAAPTYP